MQKRKEENGMAIDQRDFDVEFKGFFLSLLEIKLKLVCYMKV